MLETSARLLRLLTLLQSRRDWSGGELAERLGVPSGTLLLTIDQVDRTADGVAVLVSREHHLADAFDFTLVRRGPAEEH